jgi:hypothetical protein
MCETCYFAKRAHLPRRKAYDAAYNAAHKQERAAYQVVYHVAYAVAHKKEKAIYDAAYFVRRYWADLGFRLRTALRVRLAHACRRGQKAGSAVRDLGCSISHLKLHLELFWAEGMSWENYGRGGWVIDHIKPLARFDLTDRAQLLEACHFTNLQPMWATDNAAKGDRYGGE